MDVYHNGNFWSTGRQGTRLTAFWVRQCFLWEKQEIHIPAIYTGREGAVLDVCAKIPVEDMAAFLKKWPKERRLSLKTPEDYEQIEADNPGSRDFLAEMSLDDTPLQLGFSSSINWYPESVFRMGYETSAPEQEEEWKNHKAADMLMEAYGCDRECCWHFGRLNYNWTKEPVLSPHKVTLDFRGIQIPVTAGYFTTTTNTAGQLQVSAGQPVPPLPCAGHSAPLPTSDLPSDEPPAYSRRPVPPETSSAQPERPSASGDVKTLKTLHPVTGQEYTVTLYECLQTRHSFADMGAKDVLYPEYSHMLSYQISPEISRELFDIRDCEDGDHPILKSTPEHSRGEQGARAVFMAGKSAFPERRTAASSLHFEPAAEIRWRMVFQIQARPNRKITFSI